MNLFRLTVTWASERSAPNASGAGPSTEFAQITNPKTITATRKNPSRRGFANFIPSPGVISPWPKFHRTFSRLIFLSTCFAGWDDRNTESMVHSPSDKERRAQTSRPNCEWNISAGLFQKLSDPGRQLLWASGSPNPARGTAGNCLILRGSAYSLEAHNDRKRLNRGLLKRDHRSLRQPMVDSRTRRGTRPGIKIRPRHPP